MHLFTHRVHHTSNLAALSGIKTEIEASGWNSASGTPEFEMFSNHVGREFNKKCILLGNSGLAFSPYDAGFRPIYEAVEHPADHLMTIDGDYLETIGGLHLQLI